MNALVWLGNYISTERTFLKAATLGLGLPAAALGAWALNDYGDVASVLVVPFAFIGAYVWGLIMWRVMFRDIYARIETRKQQQAGSVKPAERRNS